MIDRSSKRKILITGGSGFIGSQLKKSLQNYDFEITTIGRSKNEDYQIDLSDSKLKDLIKDFSPDIVCHLASGSNILRAEEDKEKEYKDTVLSVRNLINSLCELRNAFVIYLSSQAVYGIPEKLPVTEAHPTKPVSVYGENKLEVENEIIQSGLSYLIFRISSIYGPGQDYKKSGVIAKFINKMKSNEPPVVFNGLEMFSDFIYVRDVIDVITLAIQKIEDKNIKNQIFNLGLGKAVSLKEVLDILYRFFPVAPKPKLETNFHYPYGEYKGLYLDTNKIKSKLNWNCKYSIEEGLKDMLKAGNLISKI